jgi:uncharacterized integral membrane protein
MRALVWSFRLILFLLLFAFAAKNTEPVTLRLFFATSWQVPLVVLLVVFFAAGALFGVLAMTAPYVRQWRAKRRLLKDAVKPAVPAVVEPPRSES